MEIEMRLIKIKCDRCGKPIYWSGNDLWEDTKKKDSGTFDYCDDCYNILIMKQELEQIAHDSGISPKEILRRTLEHYQD